MMVDRIVVYFKLSRLWKYRVRMLLHAVFNYNSSVYLSKRFVFISTISSCSSGRGDSVLSTPIHVTVKDNRSFTVSACHYWTNSIKITSTTSINALCSGLKLSRILGLREIDTCLRFGLAVWQQGYECDRGICIFIISCYISIN